MRYDLLDAYSRTDSAIHRIPAGRKLVSALAVVMIVIVSPPSRWWIFAGVAAALVGAAWLSRAPAAFLARRLLLLEPFAVGGALLSIFQPNGWAVFLSILLKSTLCLFTMILLSSTTPFDELLRVLRRARVPGLMITTLALMYRYLFVLVDESQRMRRARKSRTFNCKEARNWMTPAGIAARLFVRAGERAERIYAAMCARGWK